MNKFTSLLAAGLFTIAATQAQAQTVTNATPNFYIGLGATVAEGSNDDATHVSPKLFGGYAFDPNWAVEAGYVHFDSHDGNSWWDSDHSAYVAGKYTIPMTDNLSAYAKLGVSSSERANIRDTGAYGGLGLQYKLNPTFSVIGEYERFGKDKESGAKPDVFTVGLKVGF